MIRVEVFPRSASGWHVMVTDEYIMRDSTPFRTKFFALLYARNESKRLYKETGQTVSLKIKSKNGRYQEERTYGHDPARTPG